MELKRRIKPEPKKLWIERRQSLNRTFAEIAQESLAV